MSMKLNEVKKRILPISESVKKGFESEAKITDFEILKSLASDENGHLILVRHKETKAEYAIEEKYKVHHKNIVKLFGHFEDNNYCYFIMEYISKGNLTELLPKDKKKRLSTKICSFIIRDVISSIYYLHHMNPPIILDYIKLENILISDNLCAKLANLGWSNFIKIDFGRKALKNFTDNLPPEIIEGKQYDEAANIWCIGVLLYEMLTSVPPFEGKDFDSALHNILKLKINWPKDIDVDAKDLIEKILKIDPKERLSLEEMMKHPFITKFTPNADKLLIKPLEGIKYEPFIISKDNPKT